MYVNEYFQSNSWVNSFRLPILSKNCIFRFPLVFFHLRNFKMRVAIIGAGASGLTCIKCCKDEGLEPVCFEQEDSIGGLWYYTDEERHSSVYKSTVINTSKEMMCFSDFPVPKEYPPFLHHDMIMKYLHLYAKSFDLYKYIRYRTKVVDLRKVTDFEESGKWELLFQDLNSKDLKEVKKKCTMLSCCVWVTTRSLRGQVFLEWTSLQGS